MFLSNTSVGASVATGLSLQGGRPRGGALTRRTGLRTRSPAHRLRHQDPPSPAQGAGEEEESAAGKAQVLGRRQELPTSPRGSPKPHRGGESGRRLEG